MKRNLVILFVCSISILALFGCSKEAPREIHLNQLTRVDVQGSTVEHGNNETIITEKEKIKTVREVFSRIEWEHNVKVEMIRKEDKKVTLFFTTDKNMPESLFEYLIWFNQGDTSVTIVDREKNSLGTLDKEDSQILKNILVDY
ncbi:hypothetical protein FZW96_11245 [Bacillus sp. BGMRC 2118]|nr:hypothetical protein FZW96_11245 [Bacillus sp. BGMRC 2118]